MSIVSKAQRDMMKKADAKKKRDEKQEKKKVFDEKLPIFTNSVQILDDEIALLEIRCQQLKIEKQKLKREFAGYCVCVYGKEVIRTRYGETYRTCQYCGREDLVSSVC